MKLFGWKGATAASRPALSRTLMWSGGALGDWPDGYEAQVRAAIYANPVAQRAARLVSEAAGGVRLKASSERPQDAAVALALVNRTSAGQCLVEMLALHLLLHGNGYAQILPDMDGNPAELFALRPERVKVDVNAGGWPVAYIYRIGERSTRLAAEDGGGRPAIVHLKAISPLDDHYGLGCSGAAAGAVALHNAATRWNKALLDNAARPSGAIVHEPGKDGAALSSDQYERLKAELEQAFQGADNAGRPMLLEGGLKWQALSLSPADMDFIALKAAAARDIALAFGVPPMLLGLPGDNTYANYREANRALWRQTILPLVGKICNGIAQGLASWFPGLKLEIDREAVPELAEDRDALWTRVSAADFLTPDEKRALLGLTTHAQGEAG